MGRRQEEAGRVVLNGAVYVASPAWLRRYQQFVEPGRTRGLLVAVERSLDIDTAHDFWLAEQLWARSGKRRGRGDRLL